MTEIKLTRFNNGRAIAFTSQAVPLENALQSVDKAQLESRLHMDCYRFPVEQIY